jgi:hypothetical protein
MEDKIEDLLSFCSEIDFGAVNLSNGEKEFYSELKNEIISLCKSLPESTKTDTSLFFMRYFRIPIGQELDFFRDYYVSAWSIIYWLVQSCPGDKMLENQDMKSAITAHTMALFLHSLDDHLNDNEIPATHLTLLLRSQSWMIMNNALNQLADGVDKGHKIIQGFIDDYYSGIQSSKNIESLDSYCELFRKQMATGLITPFLMTKKMGTDERFTEAILTAYGSFGIAWRLLDDIKDIETDMMKGTHSSIYTCLSKNIRNHWDKNTGDENSGSARIILNCILENCIIERIKDRICRELELAASIADSYKMMGFADEFRCLSRPLGNRQGPLSTGMLKRKSFRP